MQHSRAIVARRSACTLVSEGRVKGERNEVSKSTIGVACFDESMNFMNNQNNVGLLRKMTSDKRAGAGFVGT